MPGAGTRVEGFRAGLRMLLAAPSVGALPERVRAIVAAQDRASERLIGTIQIAIGLLLALLYALAPRPDDSLTSM